MRDRALKPKAWSDARTAAERARTALEAARLDRDAVQAELRATERMRRLAPMARRRDEQIQALKAYESTLDLGRQREDAAEKLIHEADETVRERSAAEQLRADLAERRSKVVADPTVLAEGSEVDQLVADAGAETKAARDLVGLESEHVAAVALVERLRKESAGNADAAPQRAMAARLRELARIHGELKAAGRQLAESREDIEGRRTRAKAKLTGDAAEAGALAPVLAMAGRRRARIEEASQQRRLAQSELDQVEAEAAIVDRRQQRLDPELATNAKAWTEAVSEAGLDLDVSTCGAILDLLDELREALASEALLGRRIEGIARDAREHAHRVEQLADRIGVESGETAARLRTLRERLAAARSAAALLTALDEEDRRREGESTEAQAKLKAVEESLSPLLLETKSANRTELTTAIEKSRWMRNLEGEIASTERLIVDEGDGLPLAELVAAVVTCDPEQIAERVSSLNTRLGELNHEADEAATAHGDARSSFAALDTETTSAVDAAADAEQARAELEVLAEHFILKRAQAVTLKWAIEKYRERHQDPLLLRAGELFSTLTIGRYAALRVDTDGPSPRLLGLRYDGRTIVDVEAMSEGTTDQLFLALRLAALEQSVAAGISLPFLADDLFVNFDDQRAEAGFKVLADVAKSTQVLFFTHHPHLVAIAKSVVGAELHSECALR